MTSYPPSSKWDVGYYVAEAMAEHRKGTAMIGAERNEQNMTDLTHEEIIAKMTDRNGTKLQCADRVVLKDGRRGTMHCWTEKGTAVRLDDPVTFGGYDYTHVDVALYDLVKE